MPRQSTTDPFLDEASPKTPKRLIVCCDGTWMASDHASKDDSSYQTNITRMCHALADDGVRDDGTLIPQIVYYQDGVGTSGPDFLKLVAGARIFSIDREVITGDTGGLGRGVDHNILAAYNFLVNNYVPDDEIFLFGFSRGSFTCRSLAGLISDFGILKQSESGKWFARIWDRYQGIVSDPRWERKKKKRFLMTASLLKSWDAGTLSVASVFPKGGSPSSSGCVRSMPSITLNSRIVRPSLLFYSLLIDVRATDIEYAFHVLALDERRGPFSPTLWYIPPSSKKEDRSTTLIQCWFPGVHTDVGRGYEDHVPGDMADITFTWMVEQCTGHLSFSQTTFNEMTKGGDFKKPTTLEKRQQRKAEEKRQQRKDQADKWGMADLHDSMRTLVGWLTKSETRTPGQYPFQSRNLVRDKRNGSWIHITGAANTSSDRETSMVTASQVVGNARPPTKPWYKHFIPWLKRAFTHKSGNKPTPVCTLEYIHPCVRVRMFKDPEYDPPSLRGYNLVRHAEDDRWSWVKEWTADDGTVHRVELPEPHGPLISDEAA